MRWLLVLTSLSGCAELPPFDLIGGRVISFCVINCPIMLLVNDDGVITDAVPLDYPHVSPESLRAVNERSAGREVAP